MGEYSHIRGRESGDGGWGEAISNSYSTVARDLSLETIPRLRAQPEGKWLFSTINPIAIVL